VDILGAIGAVIGFLVYAYLMYRQNALIEKQNAIFEEQNRLMSKKKGATMQPLSKGSLLTNYWPLAAMAALTILTWGSLAGAYYYSKRPATNDQTLTVSISSAEAPVDYPNMSVIVHETFEDNSSIPLDGHIYKDCTFKNSCLMYDGGAYRLENATFEGSRKICVRTPRLKNLVQLQADIKKGPALENKMVIPFFANPTPSD
jgi:hypothetical protein